MKVRNSVLKAELPGPRIGTTTWYISINTHWINEFMNFHISPFLFFFSLFFFLSFFPSDYQASFPD